jgi:hypothetical protein
MLLLRIICPGKVCKTSLESFGLAEGTALMLHPLLVTWQLAWVYLMLLLQNEYILSRISC